MANFGENSGEKRQAGMAKAGKQFLITESQCQCCQSPHRASIDKLLATGTSYAEISRIFGVAAGSISRHSKQHLNVEDAAIERIVAKEAALTEQNIEEGIYGFTRRRAYIELALEKGMEALVAGNVKVSPRDMGNLIDLAEKLDKQVYGATAQDVMIQFNAFVQAMKEVLTPEQQFEITVRTKEILNESPAEQLNP